MRALPSIAMAVCTALLTFPLNAQTLVVPVAPAAKTANSNNAFPWNRRTSQIRFQQMYAASNFAAIKSPIIISRLRFRAVDTAATTSTWSGGTYTGARVSMSTGATVFTSISATFAANHGKDLMQVFPKPGGNNLGSIKVAAGAGTGSGVPGVWYVDVPLAQNFMFDPTQGKDLVVEVQLDGNWTPSSGTSSQTAAYSGSAVNAQGARAYNTTSWTAATASGRSVNHTLATEFTYTPAAGLFASFTATPTVGGPNMKVQFTDTSFSSATGGVLTWAWDFDGDKKVDSTLKNPTFTYKCGKFSPSLTVTDSKHAPSTRTETDLISAGVVTAAFDVTGDTTGPAPLKLTFTDKSIGVPSAYQWDFDGDNKIDSTLKNPTFTYTTPGTYDVSLNVIGCGNSHKITKKALVTACGPNTNVGSLTTIFLGGNGLTANGAGQLFDMEITNKNGLKFTSIDINTRASSGNVAIDVYVTPGTWAGKDNNRAVWTMVTTGSGTTQGGGGTTPTPIDVADFYLPAGKYGVYIIYKNGGIHYTNGNGSNQKFVNCDLTLTLGVGKNVMFSGGVFNPRVWNGRFHYAKNDKAGAGGFGFGCPGSNSATPFLAASADPVVGTTINLNITNMVNANTAGLLFVGGTTAQTDLTNIGMPNCALFTNALSTLGFANIGGKATLPGPIPNNASLVGVQVFLQAANNDAQANTLGVAASNALAVRIGNK